MPESMRRYAEVIVKVGLNLEPGQRLLINAPLPAAELVRRVVERAYQGGARLVSILWEDEQTTLARFRHAPRDSFTEFPLWRKKALVEELRRGSAYLWISAGDPELLAGQDPQLLATYLKTRNRHRQPFNRMIMSNAVNWCVAAAAVPAWAMRVFPDTGPDAGPDAAVAKLRRAILHVCRIDTADPVAAWREHIRTLESRTEYLNARRFSRLEYEGPGTRLSVGLPEAHRWIGGRSRSRTGITFTPNIPTEEVFTAPHRNGVDGVVTASKPLCYKGNVITGMRMWFERGALSRIEAEQGGELLETLVNTDRGSRRLGEVAIVPEDSPVAAAGMLFYSTLFDENASCHFALGNAYREALDGAGDMSAGQYREAGGNRSSIHVDFMVGSRGLDIHGVHADGRRETLLRRGVWVAGGEQR